MKIIKVIILSLLALCLIVLTGFTILVQTFDPDQYLLETNKKASIELGRPVFIGHLGLGLSWHGLTLDAFPIIIADDAAFTTQPFIKINRVRIGVDVGAFIFKRRIHITRIIIQSPQIHFIRHLDGELNMNSIINLRKSIEGYSPNRRKIPTDARKNIPDNALSTEVKEPKTPTPSYFKDLSLNSIKIQDASISFIDQNRNMPLDIWLSNINVNLNEFSIYKPFRLNLNACFYSDNPNVHGSALVSIKTDSSAVSLSDLKLDTDLSLLDLEQVKGISPHLSEKMNFKGVGGVIKFNLTHLEIGTSGNLMTNGRVVILGGIIKNFNIIKSILAKTLGSFGWMEGNIENLLNGQIKDKLDAPDTGIDRAYLQFSLHDKVFNIDDLLIKTNIFEFTAQGSMDQALNMEMQTILHLNEDVSSALINQLDGLKLLCDDTKRITIDASLNGVVPHLKYKPNKDFRKKSKKALIEEGGNILGILLGAGQKTIQVPDSSTEDTGKKSKNKFKNILKSLLQ